MTYEMHNRRNWRASRTDKSSKEYRHFRLLEKMFYYYHRIKRAVEEVKMERGYYQSTGKTGGGSSNHAFVSDPTAVMALKHSAPIPKIIINAERLDEEVIANPEAWITVVEQTMMFFDEEEQIGELMRRRFFNNESCHRTCIDLGISEDKYYRLLKIGIAYARECAIQLGLIKVFEIE